MKQQGEYRLLVCPDHPTFLRTRTHSHGYCPFAMCGSELEPDAAATYSEVTAAASSVALPHGWDLMGKFMNT
jgi:2,3-bisphosphoglycerate-independent phosphoglycerate mutase